MNMQNTKAIARKTGLTTAQVNEIARDLGIEMQYIAQLHYWEICNPVEAKALLDTILDVLPKQQQD